MPEKVLSLALRPRSLEFLVAHKKLITALRNQMATRPPATLLFYGPPGTGKTTLARIVALSFQCSHQKLWGQPCDACWNDFDHLTFDIHELNVAQTGGKGDVDALVKLSKFNPMPPSLKRVFILDEAHNLTADAKQLLLKPFEEPSANTIWIICTTDPSKIPAAMQRRCLSYGMEVMNTPERVEFLLKRAAKHIGFAQPLAPLVEQLRKNEITSPGFILMALEHFTSGQTAHESVMAVLNQSVGRTDTYAICKATVIGSWKDVRLHLKDAVPEESRFIRASVAGYLKGCLLREGDPAKVEKLALATRTLMGMAPLTDAELFPWIVATLAQVCKILK